MLHGEAMEILRWHDDYFSPFVAPRDGNITSKGKLLNVVPLGWGNVLRCVHSSSTYNTLHVPLEAFDCAFGGYVSPRWGDPVCFERALLAEVWGPCSNSPSVLSLVSVFLCAVLVPYMASGSAR